MRKIRKRFIVWLSPKSKLRLMVGVCLIVVAVVLLSRGVPGSSTWPVWSMPLSGMTIAIDAGHGGVDGGAVSKSGAIEKDLSLSIALYLRDYLQQAGAIVVMTREGDYDLANEHTRSYSKRKTEDLMKRVAVLQEANPEMLISIHMNSIPSEKWSGAQTFYHKTAIKQSEELARSIQEQLKVNLQNTEREAATVETIYILKSMQHIPAALVEVGFLSNPRESQLLVDAQYQRTVAASIYKGILQHITANTDQEQTE
ncbi:germination-specific N-acetylmuramoyl-L-alanine amidase [Paenibacillus montaniterrae]|uniref:Germination-specific N-acetylmuramoyl-L-alanine amidase n=1 Tax=Paenibacillus montaniterrae TaxID=429341 RepID=A0A920D242_9BACL|nr:N-acetylmuramoyl-L-alanine amidase CwlD [Paenibacillus montaniterrae]GIP19569.1 germination-specific N-acetylmuramoyl-L-alanine amidase [Paenibacillus montaniterrae]